MWAFLGVVLKVGYDWIQKKLEKVTTDRKTDLDEFTLIKNSLREEVDRLDEKCNNMQKRLQDSESETDKCERRYYELASQHNELIEYCERLRRDISALEKHVKGLNDVDKTTTHSGVDSPTRENG